MEGDESIEHVDVLIVGAGMSGVDAAYRIQTMPGQNLRDP